MATQIRTRDRKLERSRKICRFILHLFVFIFVILFFASVFWFFPFVVKIHPICFCIRDSETYIYISAAGYQLRFSHRGNVFLKYEDIPDKKFVGTRKSRETTISRYPLSAYVIINTLKIFQFRKTDSMLFHSQHISVE